MNIALIYLCLITLAEILTATIGAGLNIVSVGLSLHGLILIVLVLHGATTRQTQTRRLLLSLVIAPLIRILSLSLPLQGVPLVDWYLTIGALLYMATFFAAQINGISWQRMGLTMKGWLSQLPLALIGFVLGFIEYYILGSHPLISNLSWETLLYPAFVLMIFTGFLEEIIFRGLIQEVSTTMMGKLGIWYGALLFAVLHIGYLSVVDVVFVFAVGLLFGYIAQRTRSLLGVSLAHGFTNISMYLIFPFVLAGGIFPAGPTRTTPELLSIPATPVAIVEPTPALVFFVTATPGPQATEIPTLTVPPPTEQPTTASLPSVVSRTAIPTRACVVPANWVVYVVQPGDSLYGISLKFHIALSDLENANCLSTTVIRTGQKLYVPFALTSTPALSTAIPSPTLTFTNTATVEVDTSTPIPSETLAPTATDTSPPPVPSDTPGG